MHHFFQVCELREGEKIKYITFYCTSEISFLFIRIIEELDKICPCSGPTPDQSYQNLCGGMGQVYVTLPPPGFYCATRVEMKGNRKRIWNSTHIWLNNQRLTYLWLGFLPSIHVNHVFGKSLLSPTLK